MWESAQKGGTEWERVLRRLHAECRASRRAQSQDTKITAWVETKSQALNQERSFKVSSICGHLISAFRTNISIFIHSDSKFPLSRCWRHTCPCCAWRGRYFHVLLLSVLVGWLPGWRNPELHVLSASGHRLASTTLYTLT